nr:hypothetical protein [Saccharopolyspora karakumensis]
MAKVVALEGAPNGIKTNTILPAAANRMAAGMNLETLAGLPTTPAHGEPEMVTAMASYLASEKNPYNHEAISIARGRYARLSSGDRRAPRAFRCACRHRRRHCRAHRSDP